MANWQNFRLELARMDAAAEETMGAREPDLPPPTVMYKSSGGSDGREGVGAAAGLSILCERLQVGGEPNGDEV